MGLSKGMKIFHCDHCQQLVFFENVSCTNCGHALAYLPDVEEICSLDRTDSGMWHSPNPRAQGTVYRLCRNYQDEGVCNWAVRADEAQPLCASCRLTRVIPDLGRPGSREAWYKLEVAKRRLIFTLMRLRLPLLSKTADPERGLAFEFLASVGGEPVLTGHDNGLITINVAEADDAERERLRAAMHEPYRTLLGHFRHEIGHYYWERLIRDSEWHARFRERFGDEREDYHGALQRHYEQGAPPDWQSRFVSAYASAHPWEDWAETWAHYLHLVDTLETAQVCGLALHPPRADEPGLPLAPGDPVRSTFDQLIRDWFPVTYVMNNLNRGMGIADAYPFVLSPAAIDKLRFVHETIDAYGALPQRVPTAGPA